MLLRSVTGCSVVWLARLLWEQEAVSSNLTIPTIFSTLRNLQIRQFLMDHDIYGISRWGDGLVGVLPNGNVALNDPLVPQGKPVDLAEVIQKLEQRGIQTPVLLRVSNFLEHRIQAINESFRNAIEQFGYQGDYRGVFPIKVNQQAHVVERVSQYGEAFHFGLEVGSKAELLIALAQNVDSFLNEQRYPHLQYRNYLHRQLCGPCLTVLHIGVTQGNLRHL
jgi:arginine decarboxylase-like protein